MTRLSLYYTSLSMYRRMPYLCTFLLVGPVGIEPTTEGL